MGSVKVTENTLLAELAASLSLPAYDPTVEVTAPELAKALGVTFITAKRRLEEAQMESRTVRMPDGKRAKAYRR